MQSQPKNDQARENKGKDSSSAYGAVRLRGLTPSPAAAHRHPTGTVHLPAPPPAASAMRRSRSAISTPRRCTTPSSLCLRATAPALTGISGGSAAAPAPAMAASAVLARGPIGGLRSRGGGDPGDGGGDAPPAAAESAAACRARGPATARASRRARPSRCE
jgi:hypothetical protein